MFKHTNTYLRNRNFYIMLFMDASMVSICFYLAYLIRFEFSIPTEYFRTFLKTWPYVLVLKIIAFAFFRLYKGMWRYTSLSDIVNLIKAVGTSSLVLIMGVLMIEGFSGHPRSVFTLQLHKKLIVEVVFGLRSPIDCG